MTLARKSQIARKIARSVGFDLAGVTVAGRVPQSEYYRNWLANRYHGSMDYMRRNVELREDPGRLLDGARSILCVALNYKRDQHDPPNPARTPTGRVAQYSRGADYHGVMKRMLAEVAERMRREIDEPFEHRAFVDTGPLLERALAAAAGLGWVGKNTLLMHEEVGSFLFLGELITTLEMAPDTPVPDHCGSCTRCLDACPTAAFPEPYRLDASRCISYFTIEHRGEVPAEFQHAIGDWVFGCDICQDVCPHNTHAPSVRNEALAERRVPERIDLVDLLRLTSGDYKRLTRGATTSRAKRSMWRRNAAIALGNAKPAEDHSRDALAAAAQDDDALVSTAAKSALRRADDMTG